MVRRYLTIIKTTVSSKGQIVLPAEFRQQDGIEAGQEFDIERLDRGEYLLQRRSPRVNEGAVDWLLDCPEKGFFGEVRFGILLLPKGRRRTRLEQWFDEGAQRIHCLPFEAATGLRWAELLAKLRASGRAMPVKNSLIAATALANGLAVAARNGVDFEKAGVDIIDPFVA